MRQEYARSNAVFSLVAECAERPHIPGSIRRVTEGNTQGYAEGHAVAINPVAALPHKTLFHELAHIILGHTAEEATDSTSKPLREAEAESVALLLIETLGLPGSEYSRGYLQHWLAGNTIPERSAQNIFTTADRILKAGTTPTTEKPGATAARKHAA